MEAERKKGVDFFYSKKNFTWSDRGREAVNTRGRADSNRFYRFGRKRSDRRSQNRETETNRLRKKKTAQKDLRWLCKVEKIAGHAYDSHKYDCRSYLWKHDSNFQTRLSEF